MILVAVVFHLSGLIMLDDPTDVSFFQILILAAHPCLARLLNNHHEESSYRSISSAPPTTTGNPIHGKCDIILNMQFITVKKESVLISCLIEGLTWIFISTFILSWRIIMKINR